MTNRYLEGKIETLKTEFPGHEHWIDKQLAEYLAEPEPPDDVEFIAFTRRALESVTGRN